MINNFRGKLWRIICKADDVKYNVLIDYTMKREKSLEDSRQVPESFKTDEQQT